MRPFSRILLGAACVVLHVGTAGALPLPLPLRPAAAELVTPVAQGCGPGWWRGPWGHCRDTPYYGPLPDGGNGCPAGYWRGPWGHCRDTPYHGPLPGGGWK